MFWYCEMHRHGTVCHPEQPSHDFQVKRQGYDNVEPVTRGKTGVVFLRKSQPANPLWPLAYGHVPQFFSSRDLEIEGDQETDQKIANVVISTASKRREGLEVRGCIYISEFGHTTPYRCVTPFRRSCRCRNCHRFIVRFPSRLSGQLQVDNSFVGTPA